MSTQKEFRISLSEVNFTGLCKTGVIQHGTGYEREDVRISSADIRSLATGNIITKELQDGIMLIGLQDIGTPNIMEIIKRSPIYSQMYYDIIWK